MTERHLKGNYVVRFKAPINIRTASAIARTVPHLVKHDKGGKRGSLSELFCCPPRALRVVRSSQPTEPSSLTKVQTSWVVTLIPRMFISYADRLAADF